MDDPRIMLLVDDAMIAVCSLTLSWVLIVSPLFGLFGVDTNEQVQATIDSFQPVQPEPPRASTLIDCQNEMASGITSSTPAICRPKCRYLYKSFKDAIESKQSITMCTL